jgi:hypothetical protein
MGIASERGVRYYQRRRGTRATVFIARFYISLLVTILLRDLGLKPG